MRKSDFYVKFNGSATAKRFALTLISLLLAGSTSQNIFAHDGQPHDLDGTEFPNRVFLPLVQKDGASGPPTHEKNDYILAEEARQRNEPPFVPDPKDLREPQAPTALIDTGQWGSTITFPFVFATAANLPDGRIAFWGANNTNSFNGGTNTFASIWDPNTNQFLSRNVTNHSMFCAIPTMLEDGRVFVNGGDGTRERTSIFDYRTNTWTRSNDMSVGRWYNGAVALPNGKVFTALGDPGNNYPEVWTEGQGWSLLTGANLQNGLLNQSGYQFNWLPYFHLAPNGQIFHHGPTAQMNWINPTGNGSISSAGTGTGWYPKYSVGVMYDEGKILVAGGQASGSSRAGVRNAMIIDINGSTPQKTTVSSMANARSFPSGVVLPNGEVLVIGGNTTGTEFSDNGSVLPSEIWNPSTRTWRTVASITVPRNYHSVALLMTDGRVFSGGGGLCACNADHPNAQIFTPPYLFNSDGSLATRPTINSAPNIVSYGRVFTLQGSSGINRFTMIKMTGTTHDLNSDLRFLNVPFTGSNGSYQLTLHSNQNVLTPGYWMLFALNSQGVPSVAKVIQVVSSGAPRVTNPGNQSGLVNNSVSLAISAIDPNGQTLTYSASGLPPGLNINSSSGLISGSPTTTGVYQVTVSVSDGGTSVPVNFSWTITSPDAQPPRYRYVRLVANSEVNGNPWTSVAELNVLDANNATLSRSGWTVTADSQETVGEQGQATRAIDGSTSTYWHTQWQGSSPAHPHWLRVDMGTTNTIGGFRYLPRQGTTSNGRIANYAFYVSNDGTNWGNPVAQGTFPNTTSQQTVTFNLSPNTPPTLGAIANQTTTVNTSVSLGLTASDVDGNPLTFSASGLPSGLSINASTGVIAGTPTATGTYNVTVTVSDGRGGSANRSFVWVIQNPPPALSLNPINSSPKPTNTSVAYTASANNGINPRYKWLFGDGTAETAYSTSPNISHSFAQPGQYIVKLTATDDRGVEQSITFAQAIHLPTTSNRPNTSSNIVYETRTSGNNRVWVVNQDNDSVSVFDAVTHAKLAEIAVGSRPRSIAIAPNGNIWVANKGAATISIINPGTLAVAQTVALPFASQPFGIAFAPTGGSAFVTLEAGGKLLKLDASSGAQTASLDVGANPRGVAVSADGATVLVSRFITPRLPGEETATVSTNASTGGELVRISASTMSIQKTIVLQHSEAGDSEASGRGIPNYLGAAVISPDGGTAWVPSKQDNVKRGTLRDGNGLDFQNTVRAIISRVELGNNNGTEDLGGRVDMDNSSLGSAALFDRNGSYLFVALETSRHVAVIDPYARRELFRFDVGRAPEGLALSADGLRLYVSNFMDRSVGVYDLSALINSGARATTQLATLNAVATEQLPTQVLLGKQFFYDARDPRLAKDSYMSCASCHNDGGQDGRVWDFTGVGEGLRNTIALRGRGGMAHGFVHWSANFDEIQDFEGQIRAFAGGTGLMSDSAFNTGTRNTPLGTSKAGVSADLDALAAYLSSLNTFENSPFRNNDGTLTAEAQAGKLVFQSANCAQCHGGAAFSGSGNVTLFNIGTLKASSGQRLGSTLSGIDPPTLRDVWASAPYLHDGSAATLAAAVSAHNNISLNTTQVQQVVAYLQQIGGQESAPSGNQSPSVSISSPSNNVSFTAPANINIVASASDSDGSIVKVEFFNGTTKLGEDTSAPYEFGWSNVAAGAYAITAKATDNGGATTTSAAVNVTVDSTSPPPSGIVITDTLDNISRIVAFSSPSAFTFDAGWASYFSNDTSRLMRTRAGQEWTTWQLNGMSQFVATTYFWTHEAINHFTFLASSDNVNFTTVTPSISNQGGDWIKIVYTLNLPAGTNYVRVVFPNNTTSWTPQIGEVSYSSSAAPPPTPGDGSTRVDPLDNLSQTFAFSDWTAFALDTNWSSYFANDASRLMRTRSGQVWATWRFDNMNQFVATTFFWPNETINHFTFLASSDNVNFTTITPSISNQGGEWTKVVYTLSLPAGTNYVRVVFPNNPTTWSPQISEVRMSKPN